MPFVELPVKVWSDEEAWYAEVVAIPHAHANGGNRAEALANLRHVLADLKDHGLLTQSAELAMIEA